MGQSGSAPRLLHDKALRGAFVGLGLVLGLLGSLISCGTDAHDPVAPDLPLGGSSGAGGAVGHGGQAPLTGPNLDLPRTLPLPYVVAGAGGSTGTFTLQNHGDVVAEGPAGAELAWSLSGDASLALVDAPARINPGQSAPLVLSFAGAAEETIVSGQLSVQVGAGSLTATVYAVAGAPGLEAGAWETVELPGAHPCGQGLTIGLPTAPFPHGSAGFTDDTVRVFVPEAHRDVGGQDLVVHFHGHGTTVAETLQHHSYEQHLCASGTNAILIIPQGPVETASGNFGKLMDPGGLQALLRQVLVVLYRDEAIASPIVDELILTAHSGGYAAVGRNLDTATNSTPVAQVHLYDALYAMVSSFAEFAESGGVLRSNYTAGGGTVGEHLNLIAAIEQAGLAVEEEPTQEALRDAPVVIYAADTSHRGATRIDGAYGEALRFGLSRHRRGPRLELRQAEIRDGNATVTWFSPYDDDLLGFAVQTSSDGQAWTTVADVAPTVASATFAQTSATRVRVLPSVAGLAPEDALGSDIFAIEDEPEVLVVDGFDRVLDGSFGGLTHDFAASVGEASGRSPATISNEALTEGTASLDPWPAVIWLVGDESTADRSLTGAEQQLLSSYVASGGRLLLSGSEIAYDLDGAALLSSAFGADYAADDSDSSTFVGVGPLAGLGPYPYGGPAGPYEEDFPDVLATAGGTILLEYGNGQTAAVGIDSQAALVGFPLELIDDPSDRATTVSSLLDYVDP